mmetsp:Transcript_2003/g.6155  ORF Transcript_2003/g.6155 Transcript_2003/m.6155 type:complete len:332 (+) Transcript_2003:26-1021(+)
MFHTHTTCAFRFAASFPFPSLSSYFAAQGATRQVRAYQRERQAITTDHESGNEERVPELVQDLRERRQAAKGHVFCLVVQALAHVVPGCAADLAQGLVGHGGRCLERSGGVEELRLCRAPSHHLGLRETARWGHTALFVVEPRTANHLLQLAEGLPVVQNALRPQHLELAVEVVPQDFDDLAVRGFYCSRAEVKNHDTEDDGNRAQEQDRAVEAVPALAAGGTGAEDRHDAEGGNHRADHHHPNREPGDDRVDLLDVLQLEELQKLALALDPAELEVETARQQEESRDGSEGVPDPQEPLADHLVDAAHHRSGGGGGGSSVWGAVPCFRCS